MHMGSGVGGSDGPLLSIHPSIHPSSMYVDPTEPQQARRTGGASGRRRRPGSGGARWTGCSTIDWSIGWASLGGDEAACSLERRVLSCACSGGWAIRT